MTKLQPLRRRDGRVRTDACAKEYMRQARRAEEKVNVVLRRDDADTLNLMLTELMDKGEMTLMDPRSYVGARVALIKRVILALEFHQHKTPAELPTAR
jgi:hypothetical protein